MDRESLEILTHPAKARGAGRSAKARARTVLAMLSLPLAIAFLFFAATSALAGAPDRATIEARIAEEFPAVEQLATAEFAAWLSDSTRAAPLLLDVRAEREWRVSRLPGALLAPNADAALELLEDVPLDTPVVLYCSVGWRSSEAASKLLEAGRTLVFNLEGSIFAWANEGRALVDGEGKSTPFVHPYDRRWGTLVDSERHRRKP